MLDLDEPVRSTLWRPQYRPELTKRPNFTYRVKIDISASAEKPQVANFRTTGQTDRVYRTAFKVSLRPRRHRSQPLSGIMCFPTAPDQPMFFVCPLMRQSRAVR